VYVDEVIQRWIVALVRATREADIVELGASVRGTLALERAARAWALLHGRPYVVPEDVEDVFEPVLGHRVLFTPAFAAATRTLGTRAAAAALRERCAARAPRPEPAGASALR
jgi:MoxR-like ATPase